MATRTRNQVRRQDNEHRENGRYAKVNPCNLCGKSAGQDYNSDRRTDTTDSEGVDWGDIALVLCAKCARKLDGMPDGEAYALLCNAQGLPIPQRKRPEFVNVYAFIPRKGDWEIQAKGVPFERGAALQEDLISRKWQTRIEDAGKGK